MRLRRFSPLSSHVLKKQDAEIEAQERRGITAHPRPDGSPPPRRCPGCCPGGTCARQPPGSRGHPVPAWLRGRPSPAPTAQPPAQQRDTHQVEVLLGVQILHCGAQERDSSSVRGPNPPPQTPSLSGGVLLSQEPRHRVGVPTQATAAFLCWSCLSPSGVHGEPLRKHWREDSQGCYKRHPRGSKSRMITGTLLHRDARGHQGRSSLFQQAQGPPPHRQPGKGL